MGLEPTTACLEGRYSTRLSYSRFGRLHVVGVDRLELSASWSQTMRATKLRHTPAFTVYRNTRWWSISKARAVPASPHRAALCGILCTLAKLGVRCQFS